MTFGGPRHRSEIRSTTKWPFWKKNSKIFFLPPKGPSKNVWGPHKNVSLDPTVALDGPALGLTWDAFLQAKVQIICNKSKQKIFFSALPTSCSVERKQFSLTFFISPDFFRLCRCTVTLLLVTILVNWSTVNQKLALKARKWNSQLDIELWA